jgi:hypothetical protein
MARPNDLMMFLVRELRSHITNGFAPAERLPSQRVLAMMYGVGQASVHRALRCLAEENLVVVDSTRSWCRSGDALAPSRGLRIAIITPLSPEACENNLVVNLLREEGARRGMDTRLISNKRMTRHAVETTRIPWNEFDIGLLVFVEQPEILGSDLLKNRRVISVDCDATDFGLNSVVYDNYMAGKVAARHLLELGHRRLAVTDEMYPEGNQAEQTWVARRHGFESALGLYGGLLRPEWRVPVNRMNRQKPDTELAIKSWSAAAKQRPTAIFSFESSMLQQFLPALQSSELKIPKDISLTTVGTPSNFRVNGLAPTVIQLDTAMLVRRAYDAVQEVVQSKGGPSARAFLAAPILVPGETTAPPPG